MWVMVQRSPFLTQSVAHQAEASVVAAGDDHVPDTGPASVRQLDLLSGEVSPRR